MAWTRSNRSILWLLVALFAFASCKTLAISDNAWVANSVAAEKYHADRYKRTCPAVDSPLPAGPKTCGKWKQLLVDWARMNVLADQIKQFGELPSEEKAEIKKVHRKVRRLP